MNAMLYIKRTPQTILKILKFWGKKFLLLKLFCNISQSLWNSRRLSFTDGMFAVFSEL